MLKSLFIRNFVLIDSLDIRGNTMDRRQQKTKAAIFNAFRNLLEKKSFSHITVQEILDLANIGRSKIKDFLNSNDVFFQRFCLIHLIISSSKKGRAFRRVCLISP